MKHPVIYALQGYYLVVCKVPSTFFATSFSVLVVYISRPVRIWRSGEENTQPIYHSRKVPKCLHLFLNEAKLFGKYPAVKMYR